ncbi:unnamed protein product [Somion occarium]|uniref:DUF6697 domain-containing protein n=1 Tax=Somion occarium TaxID=3059160 RepID=A0ABP1CL00_9APHY
MFDNDQFVADLSESLSMALRSKTTLGLAKKALEDENFNLKQLLLSEREKFHALELKYAQSVAMKLEREQAQGSSVLVNELEDARAQLTTKDDRIHELEAELAQVQETCCELSNQVQQVQMEAEQHQEVSDAKLEKLCQDMNHSLTNASMEAMESENKMFELQTKLQISEQQNADVQAQLASSQLSLLSLQQEHESVLRVLHRDQDQAQQAVSERDAKIAELLQSLESIKAQSTAKRNPNEVPAVAQTSTQAMPLGQREQTTERRSAEQNESSQGASSSQAQRRPTTIQLSATFSVCLPSARQDTFKDHPSFVHLSEGFQNHSFSRGYLMDKLGGASQGLVAKIVNKKSLSVLHGLGSGLLFPRPDLNCWLPTMPGAHGYMFVGLQGGGKDHEKFLQPAKWSLFLPKDKKSWEYYGEYEVHRVPDLDLSLEERQSFSPEFRRGYCEITAQKADTKVKHPPESKILEIQEKYDQGQLRVPCTSLKCIGYNRQLVLDLVTPPAAEDSSKRPREEASQVQPRAKRVKTSSLQIQ